METIKNIFAFIIFSVVVVVTGNLAIKGICMLADKIIDLLSKDAKPEDANAKKDVKKDEANAKKDVKKDEANAKPEDVKKDVQKDEANAPAAPAATPAA